MQFRAMTGYGPAGVDSFRSRRFRVNSGGIYPACPDEGRERSREGGLRRPHVAPISNRELTMRRASSSRARPLSGLPAGEAGRRGISLQVSNRELDLLERDLSHCKQTAATVSNRELSTIRKSGSQPPLRKWRSRLAISDTNFRPPAPFLTGSGPQTEFDVTRRKQTTEKFLTGARTAIKDLVAQQVQP